MARIIQLVATSLFIAFSLSSSLPLLFLFSPSLVARVNLGQFFHTSETARGYSVVECVSVPGTFPWLGSMVGNTSPALNIVSLCMDLPVQLQNRT